MYPWNGMKNVTGALLTVPTGVETEVIVDKAHTWLTKEFKMNPIKSTQRAELLLFLVLGKRESLFMMITYSFR